MILFLNCLDSLCFNVFIKISYIFSHFQTLSIIKDERAATRIPVLLVIQLMFSANSLYYYGIFSLDTII